MAEDLPDKNRLTVEVEVLSKTYTFRYSDEQERQAVLRSAKEVDRRMRDVINASTNPTKPDRDRVAIVVGLNLANDLLSSAAAEKQKNTDLQKKIDLLTLNIESVLQQNR